jgi:hypothetical protein
MTRAEHVDDLEAQFDRAMFGVYEGAKGECNYNATYFLQMLHEHGGLQTARRLLSSRNPAQGFTILWECGRLDLSVEAQVLRAEFASLFTTEEREIARNRLDDYGYEVQSQQQESG